MTVTRQAERKFKIAGSTVAACGVEYASIGRDGPVVGTMGARADDCEVAREWPRSESNRYARKGNGF